ncbi:MAG: S66 family peptidase, partial [Turicibacter sp.]
GDESIRMLPYIDFDVITQNPKIFIGYSDTTITHLMFLKAGVSSFYGPSILSEFAENIEMFDYTKQSVIKTLFDASPIGEIIPSPIWTSEYLPWVECNQMIKRNVLVNEGYELLQGSGCVTGRLIGGCIDVLEMAKGTILWPDATYWDGAILFFETSEDKPSPKLFEYWLRNYGTLGVIQTVSAVCFGKCYDEAYADEYKETIHKVINLELNLPKLPILFNMNFGHTAPMFTIPIGALTKIDCDALTFEILESGVE